MSKLPDGAWRHSTYCERGVELGYDSKKPIKELSIRSSRKKRRSMRFSKESVAALLRQIKQGKDKGFRGEIRIVPLPRSSDKLLLTHEDSLVDALAFATKNPGKDSPIALDFTNQEMKEFFIGVRAGEFDFLISK